MSSSLNHAIYIQIKALVQNLSNKKSVRNAKNELLSLVELSGTEARRYMLTCLFESLDFKDPKVQNGSKDQTKTQFLVQQLTLWSSHSNFLDYFTQVIEHSLQKQSLSEYMNDVIKCLKLSLTLQITMILSLSLSPSHHTAKEGIQMLKTKLREYFEVGKPLQFSENILSSLLYVIRNNPEVEDMSEEIKFLIETNSSDKPFDFKPLFVKGLENHIVAETKDVTSLMKFAPKNLKPTGVLQDLGPVCTQSVQTLSQVLSDFPEMNEEEILEALLMMNNSPTDVDDEEARTANLTFQAVKSKLWSAVTDEPQGQKQNITWNIDNFIKVISDLYPSTKWPQVIKHLDQNNLFVRDSNALIALFKCFQKFKKFATFNFPAAVLFDRWKNPASQADFMTKLIQTGQPDAVFFNECQKRIVSLELYPNLKISSLNPPILQFFSCLDFLELLVELSESEFYTEIRTLFDLPILRCPDLLILGLVQIKPKTGMPLLDELLSHLLPLYLSNHASSMEILEAIWRINPQVMISAFSELYKRDNSSLNLSRVLDISQEIKDSLLPIVNCRDYSFSVSLGILAAKRDFLHLDQWIAKRIRAIGNPFITAIFKYLDEHIFEPCRGTIQSQFETVLERSQLSLESLVIIFQTLMNPSLEGKMSPRNKLLLTERYKELAQYFPNVISDTPWTEIEATANTLFEQTFEERLSIPELIEIMLRYKSSNNEKEKNILLCMMTNLLDEARFFSNYKPKILMIMAQIYGAVINNNLVEGQARDVTFKIIVESMKHREDRKQLEFGVRALEIFKGRLHEWPTKAVQLFSIDNLRENYFDLLEEIRYSLEAKGIQLEIPPEYIHFANMKAQEKNRAMMKGQGPSQLYPPMNPNQPRGIITQMPQEMMLGGQNAPKQGGYEGRSPLLNPGQQGYPQVGGYETSGLKSGFPESKIKELSNNFDNLTFNATQLNQPGLGGQPGQPLQPMQMGGGQGSGFTGFSGLNFDSLKGLQSVSGISGLSGANFPPIGGMPGLPSGNAFSSTAAPTNTSFTPTTTSGPSTATVTRRESNEAQQQAQANIDVRPTQQQQPSQPPVQPVSLESIFKGYDREFTDIPEEWKNRIIFSLNNCSNSNIDEKSIEIAGYLVDEKMIRWFCKYVVYQRAPIESNFHAMYLNLNLKLGKKELFTLMTKETYGLLNRILENDKAYGVTEKSSIQGNDKNSLKNLGSWLGMLTIGRNKPIVMKDFDMKTLIIEAYENQKLDYMLPLVCKILAHGNHPASVFKPKNAWMHAILSILAEIAQMPEIKMALKCEVQVLLNSFGLVEGEITPSKIITNRKMQRRNMNPRAVGVATGMGAGAGAGPQDYDLNGQNRLLSANESQLTINELPQYVTIDQKYLAILPNLKAVVAQALDRAIKEILTPVISRSVTIALFTAKELVLKDFALEPDEKKLIRGATLIVQNLAGNLALVTCREPLKIAFQQTLKTILDQVAGDEKVKEEIIHSTSVDNLDLGCALIKKAVIEKALEDVNQDPVLIEAIERRRRARETGIPFYDEQIIQIYESLPQALRPTLGGLTKDQMRIYEDFGKIAKVQETKDLKKGPGGKDPKAERKLDMESYNIVMRFEQYIYQLDRELDILAEQQNTERIKEIQIVHKRVMEMIHQHGNFEEVPYECAIRILDPLFKEQVSFRKINFFLAVLRELRQLSETLPSEILQWITAPNEKRIMKGEILIKLIKDNLVNVPELDSAFLEVLESSNNNVQYCLSIIKIIKALIVDEKLLDVTQFQKTVDYIFKNSKAFEVHPKMEKYIQDFKTAIAYTPPLNNQVRVKSVQPPTDSNYKATLQHALALFADKEAAAYDQANKKLEEWLRITSETEMPAFIKVIETTIFQAAGDTFIKFFAFMTDICVENAIAHDTRMGTYGKLHHNPAMDFSYIDAFSKLVVLLLKTVINTNKNEILEKILQSIVLTLTKNHELHRENFNQRPFFRLFYNLLFDISRRDYSFNQQEITQFLAIFTKTFDAIQPLKYPGFAFSWLELISNRNFMPLVLLNTINKQENWKSYAQLFINLFKFFKETMDGDAYKSDAYKLFYKGTLRALLVMLHDFPEFLIEASFILVENLPDKFNQVRNIIFSAFPKSMQPPDPFRATEQIEMREEFRVLPNNLFDFQERVVNTKLHEEIVKYLTAKNDVNEVYFRNICSKFLTKDANVEIKINQPVVNAFVLFVPWMIYKSNDDYPKINEWKMASYGLFWKLLVSSNQQMRETLLNSIINQIRYPNPITFYFTNLIFYIFSVPSSDDNLLEQIIKIFIDRLIVDRPHPWGIMYAFIELIKEKEVFRKKNIFKGSELEEMVKLVFKGMIKGDGTEN